MDDASPEIVRCPPPHIAEALALVLADLVPSERRGIAGTLLDADDPADLANEPLFVALRDGRIRGAAWGQRQSGNFSTFWPPQPAGLEVQTARQLAEAVVRNLDDTAVEMTQVLLSPSQSHSVEVLKHVGFRHLAELLYLTSEASRFARHASPRADLQFVPYRGPLRGRFIELIERSYEGTLDCTALDGVRRVENVINGYQATGVFRPENWLIVRWRGEEVGVLLLADHPRARHFELMYMGLVPEARGQSLGQQIVHYAQWLANRVGAERIVLAVDAANEPALRTYRRAGFETWDRRTVYVRFPGGAPQ